MSTTIPQPLALWELDNALTDATGNGYTLTNSSGSYTTGKLGGATGARASSANRDQTNAAICNLAQLTHSFSKWFFWDFVDGEGSLVQFNLDKAVGAGNRFQTSINNEAENGLSFYYPGSGTIDITASVTPNAWNHIVYSRDASGNTFKVWVNGNLAVNSTNPAPAGSGAAQRFRTQAFVFTFTDDQTAIWDLALTENQAKAVFNSGSGIAWANPWISPWSAAVPVKAASLFLGL